jgi:hypothetical protein
MGAAASSGDVACRLAAASGPELAGVVANLDADVRGRLEAALADCGEATETSAEKAEDYLGRHRIEERLCTAVKALISARPVDPTEFLVAHLRDSRPMCTMYCRGPSGNLLAELTATGDLSIEVLQNMLTEKAPPPPLAYYKLVSGEKDLNPKETLLESFPGLGNVIDVSVITVEDTAGRFVQRQCSHVLELLTDGTATFFLQEHSDRCSSTTLKAAGSFQRVEGVICVALSSFQTIHRNHEWDHETFSEMQPAEVQLEFAAEKMSLKLSKCDGGAPSTPFSFVAMGDTIGKVFERR